MVLIGTLHTFIESCMMDLTGCVVPALLARARITQVTYFVHTRKFCHALHDSLSSNNEDIVSVNL